MLRDELNSWLLPKFDAKDMFLDFDTSEVDALSEDMEKIWERAGRAVDRGIITRNEAREMMKYGRRPEPAADILTINANVIPLDVMSVPEQRTEE